MAKGGLKYYTDKDFTDAEIIADPRFSFPCSIVLKEGEKIIKETFYDLHGAKSVALFGESVNSFLTGPL